MTSKPTDRSTDYGITNVEAENLARNMHVISNHSSLLTKDVKMPLYIVPDQGQLDDLSAQCSRASITLVNPKTVREFILATNGTPIGVAVVSESIMLVLARNALTLFEDELPLVLHSVPGLVYPQGWMSLGTAFPPANWMEFVKSTAKSGVLSTTPEALESRNVGSPVSDPDTVARLRGHSNVTTLGKSPLMDADDDLDLDADVGGQ